MKYLSTLFHLILIGILLGFQSCGISSPISRNLFVKVNKQTPKQNKFEEAKITLNSNLALLKTIDSNYFSSISLEEEKSHRNIQPNLLEGKKIIFKLNKNEEINSIKGDSTKQENKHMTPEEKIKKSIHKNGLWGMILAIASLILEVLSYLFVFLVYEEWGFALSIFIVLIGGISALIGLIFSAKALHKIKKATGNSKNSKEYHKSKQMAIAGIIFSILGILAFLPLLIINAFSNF